MKLTPPQTQRTLYVIFAVSGFSGIIYESVWTHYLKLFLGHAAYAQAIVLVLFMGGLALGSWFTSRSLHATRNPLLAYAITEFGIGILGLIFDITSRFIFSYSFEHIIPILEVPWLIQVYKLICTSLLVLPQAILLGATFPLLSAGFIRNFHGTEGKSVAMLYFTNSIGAASGLLVCAFYLIQSFGLAGTLTIAATLNILIAITVYLIFKATTVTTVIPLTAARKKDLVTYTVLAASFLTGFASLIYEIVWIRMLSMVLGTSTHSFELMLSSFITGLAIGGYWIRGRIDKLEDPISYAGFIQLIMGLFAVSTVLLYGYGFKLMGFFMLALDQTSQGYLLFTLASHAIALAFMLPATICAGMTLPLFSLILVRQKNGEKSLGEIYSVNTIGAICGVVFTIFIGMPALTLKGSLMTGAIIDIATGLLLLKLVNAAIEKRKYRSYALLSTLFLVFVFNFDFDTKQMASGVFRHGVSSLDASAKILYHHDGETASVTVARRDDNLISIMTNGKPDASISMDVTLPPSTDEATMTLLAALPLSINPEAKIIANIGMGSGLTSHTALAMPTLEQVDTIEIEPAMLEGARYFLPKTERVFHDPRSHIYIDDAKTYFSTHQSRYDIIISEPSNPWVSGVSDLFTREFYHTVKNHLSNTGLLVQWTHTYEINIELLVSVLKAISHEFKFYSIYFADADNLIILAANDNPIGFPKPHLFDFPEMKNQLANVHVLNIDDLQYRFLGDQSLYNPYLLSSSIPANSDYMPYLDLNAEKSRFMKDSITDILDLRLSKVPVLDILYEQQEPRSARLSRTGYYPIQRVEDANQLYDYFKGNPRNSIISIENIVSIASLNELRDFSRNCPRLIHTPENWVNSLFRIMSGTVSYLPPHQLREIVSAISPVCDIDSIPEEISDWLTLFKSYSEQNYVRVMEVTVKLLESKSTLNNEQARFLYVSLLAGLIKMGEYPQANRLWNEYIADLYKMEKIIPIEIQLLLGRYSE